MSRAGTRQQREGWTQQQKRKLADADFVARHVMPRVPEAAAAPADTPWTVDFVRAKATGRMTIRYSFAGAADIFGKAYYDASLGVQAHQWLQHLWNKGFDARSAHQVPEALAYIADENLLLMRAARGVPLSDLIAAGPLDWAVAGTRAAAQWLAKYHAARIPGLSAETPCEKIEVLKLADALAKVAAECPQHAPVLIDLLHEFRTVAPSANSSPPLAPLHGQFRPAHVFLDGPAVIVIDLDKIRLSDPAKDVARFVHVIWKTCLEAAGDLDGADRVAQEFVSAYGAVAPANLENLAYFKALYCLKAFAKLLKSGKVEEQARQTILGEYRAEFARCTAGSLGASAAA